MDYFEQGYQKEQERKDGEKGIVCQIPRVNWNPIFSDLKRGQADQSGEAEVVREGNINVAAQPFHAPQ